MLAGMTGLRGHALTSFIEDNAAATAESRSNRRGLVTPSGRIREVTLEANTVVDVPFAEIDPIFFHPDGLLLWDESVARVELLSADPLRRSPTGTARRVAAQTVVAPLGCRHE
jgi:hypothetical protein